MANPTAAMVVIGDEILSGRTRDRNMHHLARELAKAGIDLKEARVIPDEIETIADAVRELAGRYSHVFTSGGIGPTHDDVTADAIARAFDVPIDVRDDARALLEAHYDRTGLELNEARLRMARIPQGAELIENPISAAPGFSLRNVHVMAGVPEIFEAMLASLLPRLTGGQPVMSQSIMVLRGEGDIAGPLAEIAREFSDLQIGSYPFQRDGAFGAQIVVRGTDPARIDAAMARLNELFPG